MKRAHEVWMSDRATQILDSAERMARDGGYDAFSFREIAKDIGIKSASVHYHFPNKEVLGIALVQRYSDRFIAQLGDPTSPDRDSDSLLDAYVASYQRAIVEDGQMCLCGLFAAQGAHLPETLQAETRAFLKRNIDWLQAVYQRQNMSQTASRDAAIALLGRLQGALLLASSLRDPHIFDVIASGQIPNQ